MIRQGIGQDTVSRAQQKHITVATSAMALTAWPDYSSFNHIITVSILGSGEVLLLMEDMDK